MATTLTTSTPVTLSVAALWMHHVRIPLRKTIRHASYSRDTSDNVVVRCELTDGTVGFGEGVPRDYVTGETIDTSLGLLRRGNWRSQLGPVASFGEAVDMIRAIELPPTPGDDRQCVGHAARCAVELALLDAYGKRFGVSLSELPLYLPFGQHLYEPRERVRYSGAITSKHFLRERVSAWKQRIFGFRQCKIKVGTAGQNDPARMRHLRRILGKRMDLRIDANEAWRPVEVVERIRELEPFGITAVEQPVRHEDVDCLADVRQKIATPISLDESLCSLVDAERALAGGTCDLFNLRLSKCGGLLRTLELADFARRHGLGYQLGCQVGETGILSAAGRRFACSVANIRYLEGSYDRYLVRERLTEEDLTFGWGGVATDLPRPGLGVTVSLQRLEAVSIAQEQIHG